MIVTDIVPVVACDSSPGKSECLGKIKKGACPTARSHECGSTQQSHGTESDFQKVQYRQFMRALAEGRHLEPFDDESKTSKFREIL